VGQAERKGPIYWVVLLAVIGILVLVTRHLPVGYGMLWWAWVSALSSGQGSG
jgi:hypothetical protein